MADTAVRAIPRAAFASAQPEATTPGARKRLAPPPGEPTEAIEPIELANRLRLAIGRLYRTFRRGGDTSMSTSQQLLLQAIDRSGPLRLTDLAIQQGVPPSNLTRNIRSLTERGLILRDESPTDRRAVVVAISPAGHQLVRRVAAAKAEYLGAKIDQLAPDQQRAIRQTIPLLERLLRDA